jgi:hypothetical protein
MGDYECGVIWLGVFYKVETGRLYKRIDVPT